MKKLILALAVVLLLAGVAAFAPARVHAAPAPAAKATKAVKTSVYDPIIGNWYRGKYWFRVRGPNANGTYNVAWSNGSGPLIRYKIALRYKWVYYELANHRNTYTMSSDYTRCYVHYKTTGGGYVTRTFQPVE